MPKTRTFPVTDLTENLEALLDVVNAAKAVPEFDQRIRALIATQLEYAVLLSLKLLPATRT